MKRAIVAKYGAEWHVCHVRGTHLIGGCANFPAHAEALAHAITAVGLARPAEHREAP